MKYCYAFRRFSDYPYLGNAFDMDPERITSKFLGRVKDMGFDGIELGVECLEKINGGEKGIKGGCVLFCMLYSHQFRSVCSNKVKSGLA